MKTIILLLTILVSSSAFAQRSVKNGAGLTEQNIVYLANHFQNLTSAFVQSADSSQAREVELMIQKMNSVQLLFTHETSDNSESFVISEKTWLVQTAHLSNYDLNSNQGLEWAEASDLLVDMYFRASQSSLTKEQREKFKIDLRTYFVASLKQTLFNLGTKHILQATDVEGLPGKNSIFLLQIDDSVALDLQRHSQSFLQCTGVVERTQFNGLNVKYQLVTTTKVKALLGVQLTGLCYGVAVEKRLILEIEKEGKALSLNDWGVQ